MENIVFYEGYAPPHHKEQLLPDGGVDLVIDLTQVPKHVYDNEDHSRSTPFKKAWISGFRSGPITIDAGQNSSMMVVRFRSGAAGFLTHAPLTTLTDLVVEADAIWGTDLWHFREHLLELPNPHQKVAALEKWLTNQLLREAAPNPVVAYALERIHQSPHLLTISDIQAKTGYSNKHFIHLFEKQVGATPKAYLRVIRFQKVLAQIEQTRQIQWTDLANSCGYYDQAHFIKEFKHFSGRNPSSYLAERGEFLNYIPVK